MFDAIDRNCKLPYGYGSYPNVGKVNSTPKLYGSVDRIADDGVSCFRCTQHRTTVPKVFSWRRL